MAKPKTPPKKTTKKKSAPTGANQVRRVKQPEYRTFRLSKRIKYQGSRVSSATKILRQALDLLNQHRKLFIGITLIYGLLTVVLVHGVGGGINLTNLKSTLRTGFGGKYSDLAAGATLFSYLLGSAGSSTTPAGSTYQSLLIILMSLVTIWALRQVLADKVVRVRDGFYKGAYPLIPFILVLMVVGLQLVPLGIGSWLYSTVLSSGIAVTFVEKIIWLLLFFLLTLLSLYMVCSSVFALYIVTLPDMTPLKALRSARQLVRHRRFMILRKILFLPVALLVLSAVIMIPLILFVTPLAQWMFFILTMFVLVVVHAYMYTLYRELL